MRSANDRPSVKATAEGRKTLRSNLRRRCTALLLIAVVSSLSLPVVAPQADAFNWFGATSQTGCGVGNKQDNKTMTFYRKNLTPKMSSAVTATHDNEIEPTNINIKPEHSSETSITDVVYRDWDYSAYCGYDWHPDGPDPDTSSVVGQAKCASLNGTECQKYEVRFDTSFTTSISTAKSRQLVCHEAGHTLGLKHTVNSTTCMKSGSTQTGYSTHEINDLLNVNY